MNKNLQEKYKKETGLNSYLNSQPTIKYVEWIEKKLKEKNDPEILNWIKKMFNHAKNKKWNKVYFCFDLHGTISEPDYRKNIKEIIYYPYAKETLQLLSKRKDIIMILWTSSYPEEMKIYENQLKNDDILFDFIGENPDISSEKGSFGYYCKKFYFNALIEDKTGFCPTSWESLYNYFLNQTYKPDPKWTMKYKEDYHKK